VACSWPPVEGDRALTIILEVANALPASRTWLAAIYSGEKFSGLPTTAAYSYIQQARYCAIHVCVCVRVPPFPQIDIIGAVVIVCRARGTIIRSVLFSIACNNSTQ